MIAIVGLGQVGSRVAKRLTGKQLLLIDRDVVEEKDVGAIYKKKHVGVPKAEALRQILGKHKMCVADVTDMRILGTPSLVIDCTDNFETRFLLNAYAIKKKIPFLFSAAAGELALCARFDPPGPCLSCIFRDVRETPTCTGTLDTTTLRLLVNQIVNLVSGGAGILWSFEHGVPSSYHIEKKQSCWSCVRKRSRTTVVKKVRQLCGDTIQILPGKRHHGKLQRFEQDGKTLTLFPDGRALVHGDVHVAAARRWYRRVLTDH